MIKKIVLFLGVVAIVSTLNKGGNIGCIKNISINVNIDIINVKISEFPVTNFNLSRFFSPKDFATNVLLDTLIV